MNFKTHGFLIYKENIDIGMCVISMEKEKPYVSHIYLKDEYIDKGIAEDIKKTLEGQNRG